MPFTVVCLLALKLYHLLPPKCRTRTWAVITMRVYGWLLPPPARLHPIPHLTRCGPQ